MLTRRVNSDDNGKLHATENRQITSNSPERVVYTATHRRIIDDWYIQGYDIDNFHQRMKQGELLPMTPFYRFARKGNTTGVFEEHYSNGSSWSHTWCEIPPFCPEAYWYASDNEMIFQMQHLDKQLVQEAAAKIYGQGHDSLTFIVELASLRRLFLSTGSRILEILKDFRYNDLKKISSDWLQWRYGWRTLIYDIEDIVKAIKNLKEDRRRYSESVLRIHEFTDSKVFSTTPCASITRNHVIEDKWIVSASGNVVADFDVPEFSFNLLRTGWEIIPFSFIIDWFVNVGRAIAAFSFVAFCPNYVASMGIKISLSRQYHFDTTWSPNYSGTHHQTGSSENCVMKRVPCTIPNLPYFNVNIDFKKILDLLAIIIQRK